MREADKSLSIFLSVLGAYVVRTSSLNHNHSCQLFRMSLRDKNRTHIDHTFNQGQHELCSSYHLSSPVFFFFVRLHAPMQITPTITEPFHCIALDIVGPLPRTSCKHMYILTYIDLASRYPDTEPLKIMTSQAVAEALLLIFARLSVPTDQGSNFVSTFMSEVYKFLGIKHLKTAPYRPQSNGSLERFHHTLLQMVRKTAASKTEWDQYLPLFLFACREAPSSATGYLPFELLYGKHAHGPQDVLRHQWVPTMKTPRDATDWLLTC